MRASGTEGIYAAVNYLNIGNTSLTLSAKMEDDRRSEAGRDALYANQHVQ